MKRVLFLLVASALMSCRCLLSQIPPQYIYAQAGCQAPLPNYLNAVRATDNCELASITQTPSAGVMLNSVVKTTTVVIRATDVAGNFRQISFPVTMLDTVKPVITIDTILLSYQSKQLGELYNAADEILKVADQQLMAQTWIDTYPGLREKLSDSTWYKQQLVVVSGPGYASDGRRHRFITYGDSISIMTKIRR